MMEEALLKRLRGAEAIQSVAGTHNGRATIDFEERPANDMAAFPAAVLSIVVGGRLYDQDGVTRFRQSRVRFETFGLDYGQARLLLRAITSVVEQPAAIDDVRFHQAKLVLERDGGVDDIPGGLRVSRIIADFNIPATLS